jgi:hypothetical protein
MRVRKLTALLTATAIAVALQSAPVLASKPSPGQSRGSEKSAKINEPRAWLSDSRADNRHDHDDDRRRGDYHDRRDRDRWDDRWDDRGDWYRHTYEPRYYYPHHGYVVHRLPPRYRIVHYHAAPYYYGDGYWYRPYGASFMIVAPPIGLTLSFLPDVYTTHWFGGIPYYRANDIYYRWHPERRAYMVVTMPIG